MKRNRQAIGAVSFERDRGLRGVDVPDLDRAVLKAGCQKSRVSRIPGEVKHLRGSDEICDDLLGRGIRCPDMNRLLSQVVYASREPSWLKDIAAGRPKP